VKYLPEPFASAFVQRGEILFRALSYFRDLENDEGVRADPLEGTLVHRPEEGLKVTNVSTGEILTLPHRFESSANEDEILVFCMSTTVSQELAQRFKAPVAVEIKQPVAFLGKVRSALALRKHLRANQMAHASVHYCDHSEPPIVDWALPDRIALRKDRSFCWQQEYRFVVPIGDAFRVENVKVKLTAPDSTRPERRTSHRELLIKVGKLSSICQVHRWPIEALQLVRADA
jgi:hypothetical protein